MTTKSEQSEGRGLPVGAEWRAWGFNSGLYLYPPGKDDGDFLAAAYPDGVWWAYADLDADEACDGSEHGKSATTRPGESLLAAAQREAEAALWSRDGFGVGEVRGRFVPSGSVGGSVDPNGLTAGVIDDLPGLWRVTARRPVDGGVEVDAVRAPVAPAPRLSDSQRRRRGTLIDRAEGHGPALSARERDELYGLENIATAQSRADLAAMQGEPAPAASAELAALLPGLVSDVAMVREGAKVRPEDCAPMVRLARAVVLLCEERERLTRERDALRERAEAAERHVERAMKDGATAVAGWTKTGKDLEAARERVTELEEQAKAPSPAVAGLLAAMQSQESTASGNGEPALAVGFQIAADMVREHLGGPPSPLARVAAEVCALPDDAPRAPRVDKIDDRVDEIARELEQVGIIDDGESVATARHILRRIARVALAAMIACDGATVDGAKGGTRG